MDLEIRHLQLVVAITEEKSVTKAAERLFLTQSALSHQLKEIENRLGTQLFLRLNKKMVLTDAGKLLLNSARSVLDKLVSTEREINRIAGGNQGSLKISTACYTCYHWLPPLLKDFNREYPEVEVDICVEATEKPIRALLEGKLDIAITSSLEQRHKDLEFHPLFEDEMVVVMHPKHNLANRSYIKPGDFLNQDVIIYGALEDNTAYKQIISPSGVKLGKVSSVKLTEAIVEMVKADLGIGILAKWAISSHIDSGRIKAVRLTRAGFTRQWFAVTLKTESIPAYIPEFIKQISKSAGPDRMRLAA